MPAARRDEFVAAVRDGGRARCTRRIAAKPDYTSIVSDAPLPRLLGAHRGRARARARRSCRCCRPARRADAAARRLAADADRSTSPRRHAGDAGGDLRPAAAGRELRDARRGDRARQRAAASRWRCTTSATTRGRASACSAQTHVRRRHHQRHAAAFRPRGAAVRRRRAIAAWALTTASELRAFSNEKAVFHQSRFAGRQAALAALRRDLRPGARGAEAPRRADAGMLEATSPGNPTAARRRLLLRNGVGFVVGADGAGGVPFPQGPVRVVVPASAGGAADALMRDGSQRACSEFGQPVVIDNRPGAAGAIACERCSRRRPTDTR